MIDFTAFLVAVGPVALGITKATDFIRNAFDKGENPDSLPPWVWNVVPAVLGVGYCLVVGQPANFIQLISGVRPEVTSSLANNWGLVISGIILGGLAGFWHGALDAWSS